METIVSMKKGGSHVWIVVIFKPIELETASTQMLDNLSKFDIMEFTSHSTDNIGFI